LLEVERLQVFFPVKAGLLRRRVGWVRAVDGVSLSVRAGETVGLVGESGCGKTTTGRAIMGLVPISNGAVRFDGRDITHLGSSEMRKVRRNMQYIFQDPYSSLNPIKTVGEIVAEPLRIHGLYDGDSGARWVSELFDLVGLPASMMNRFPQEFSGGQRQRIGIARALAVGPEFLVCDEAVAALDVSIQAQILNLFMQLRRELDLTYLFISHDLGVVEHLSDRVVIMYLGRVVEEASAEVAFARANHPYTQSLLASVPRIEARKRAFAVVKGEIPSPLDPPPGCHFHPRCPHALPRCRVEAPVLREVAPGHRSACHLNDAA
jgi:peptide/nickel transport system ATP-binding protein